MRLDVMSKLRGLPVFETLWSRRTTLETGDDAIDILSLPDLINAKKTQLDKDWPMIARLVEAHYARHADAPADACGFGSPVCPLSAASPVGVAGLTPDAG